MNLQPDGGWAATWFIPLPEPIGIPSGATLLMQYDDRNAPYIQGGAHHGVRAVDMLQRATGLLDVAVRLWHVPTQSINDQIMKFHAALAVRDVVTGKATQLASAGLDDLLASSRDRPNAIVTVAEVAAFLGDDFDETSVQQIDIDDLSDPLLRGLHCVRQLVRAYRLASQSPAVAPTYVRLPKYLPVATMSLDGDSGWSSIGTVELGHPNMPLKAPPAPAGPEMFGKWLANIHLLSAEDPLSLFVDRLIEADRLLTVDGDPSTALLLCAVATEAFLDALLALMLWEEVGGAPASDGPVEEAADVLAQDLRPRLKREFSKRLGGSWDLTQPGPLTDWQACVARVRNRIVHRGYEPRPVEAEAAIDASYALRTHLADLLAKKAKQYRRTALMLVGEHGLKDRMAWQTVRAFHADQAKSEPPWRDSYASWRNAVDQLVEQRARR